MMVHRSNRTGDPMGYFQWRPYVPVAQRRQNAARELAALRKMGHAPRPVHIAGRNIVTSAWGSAWCDHLESYSDYENRLPRGRTYVRNGSVVDLQIGAGKVTSLVQGSSLYRISITIRPLPAARWTQLVADTSGRIDSVVGLLRGRLDSAVMARMCDRQRGLFPSPQEIEMECSCPDWAGLCKHLAATLYGVGARLDSEPELLFVLRGVDHKELLGAGAAALAESAADRGAVVEDESALGALFGIELGEVEAAPPAQAPAAASAEPAAKASPRRKQTRKRPARPAAAAPPARASATRLSVRVPIAAKVTRKPARTPKSRSAPARKGATKRSAKRTAKLTTRRSGDLSAFIAESVERALRRR